MGALHPDEAKGAAANVIMNGHQLRAALSRLDGIIGDPARPISVVEEFRFLRMMGEADKGFDLLLSHPVLQVREEAPHRAIPGLLVLAARLPGQPREVRSGLWKRRWRRRST